MTDESERYGSDDDDGNDGNGNDYNEGDDG